MKMHRFLPLLAAALAVLPARAETNSIEDAVLRFPEISAWGFHPDIAVESANALVLAGRDSACAHLRQLAAKRWETIHQQEEANQNICLLSRLVFVASSPSASLRAPRLGALSGVPYESMSADAWPYLPFAITNEVPLSVTLGYNLGGFAERAVNYLTYCVSNGVFRTTPFPPPTPASASNALNQIFVSPAWKALKWKDSGLGWSYTLDEGYAKEMLWKQVENMANKTVQRTGASRLA